MPEINKEYAKALFLLAQEKNRVEEYAGGMSQLGGVFRENPDYLDFLSSPAIPLSERLRSVDEALEGRVPEDLTSFVKLLCESGYARIFPACEEEFSYLVKNAQNRVRVEVSSAVPLSDAQKKALCEKLEKTYGKTVDAHYRTDPSLIGGLRVEMEDMTLDGSIEKHLQKLKGVMNG